MPQEEAQHQDKMTNVYINKTNSKKEIVIKGHSGYDVAGKDIVCAAISILSHSYAELILELDAKNKLQLNYLDLGDGEISIIVSDPLNQADSAFKMFLIGIEALEESYPKHIKKYKVWEDFCKTNMLTCQ